jgi:trk system potassium uptake protein TrkH
MWRQFTQWVGGMGIVVLALAVLPRLRVGGRQLLESELPGPEVEPLAASIRDTARRLWVLYLALTAVLVGLLALYGLTGVDSRMTPYDAAAHAFTTMPTGGFSPQADSLAGFEAATQWTVILFMMVAGTNFALLYAAFVRGRGRVFLRDEEFRVYVVLAATASLVLFGELLARGLFEGEAALRHATFQAVSMMTTTGFASTDFSLWTPLALVVVVGVMLIGGSAGSTGGAIKVVRHLIIGKSLRRELDLTVHPEVVSPLRFNGRPLDERTVRAVIAFVLLYVGLFALGAFLITIDAAVAGAHVSPYEAIAASATTLGNVGPGLGFAGPFGSFEEFSSFSKVVMIVLMWMGRLEIVPVIVLATKRYWRA